VESDERLSQIGDLDLDDDELELLLQELEATMVLDRRSLWQLAGRTSGAGPEPDDDELRLDYSDVDYEMLRGHPKLRQYLRFGGSGSSGRSRLQIILNAITNSFTDLLEPAQAGAAAAAVAAIAAEGDKGLPTDDPEGEEDDAEAHRRRWSRQARINVLLKNFIQRFVAGLSSTTFQDVAGPQVVTTNYVIFLHLLARLYEREWVDAAALTDAAAATVEAMWGGQKGDGYVARLNAEDSATVLEIVREKHSDAQLLALFYLYALDARLSHSVDLRLRTRDAWRNLLLGRRLPLDRRVLHDTRVLLRPLAPPEGLPLAEVVEELRLLADFRTRGETVDALQTRFDTASGMWRFEKVSVRSPSLGKDVNVECLLIDDDEIIFTLEDAQWTLASLMQAEERPHYRVQVMSRQRPVTRFVAFYEPASRRGAYGPLALGEPSIALTNLHPPGATWDDAILDLMVAAEQEDASSHAAPTQQAVT
jgi:hypothetical protein